MYNISEKLQYIKAHTEQYQLHDKKMQSIVFLGRVTSARYVTTIK